MATDFPPAFTRQASNDWNIAGSTMGAGQSAAASNDVRSDGGGFWTASLNDIQLWDQSDPNVWRATRQICNGGLVPINVFSVDQAAPFPIGGPLVVAPLPHSDGTFFSDGTGRSQSVIAVLCDGGAALRATAMVLELINCGALGGGERFSILHDSFGWRLYEIATVETIDSTHVAITFNPPLRETINDGCEIEFDRPRCVMKLASPGAMDLNLTVLPYTRATVKFVESKFA